MGIISEFKEFAVKGNAVDMAVGIIIGAAFGSIVNSLVNDIIMPVLGKITGGLDFNNYFLSLDGAEYATLQQAKNAGAATLNYGTFITVVINFLLMALVIFILVKSLNRISDRFGQKKAEAPKTVKICPYCKTEIPLDATRCPHCTSQL